MWTVQNESRSFEPTKRDSFRQKMDSFSSFNDRSISVKAFNELGICINRGANLKAPHAQLSMSCCWWHCRCRCGRCCSDNIIFTTIHEWFISSGTCTIVVEGISFENFKFALIFKTICIVITSEFYACLA